jgi:hypothetical protein
MVARFEVVNWSISNAKPQMLQITMKVRSFKYRLTKSRHLFQRKKRRGALMPSLPERGYLTVNSGRVGSSGMSAWLYSTNLPPLTLVINLSSFI